MKQRHTTRISAIGLTLALLGGACDDGTDIVVESADPEASADEAPDDGAFDDDELDEETPDEEPTDDGAPAEDDDVPTEDGAGEAAASTDGSIDLTSTRDDVGCGADELDVDESITFTVAHYVVDGRLGATCFGDVDANLSDAWNALATIVPPGQLGDLGLFGGFETDGDTLAFVNALDADGTLFQMSVDVRSYAADPAEGLLTMAHEFSHVFTALPSQLDRTDEAIDGCTTYFNGEGCYAADSIMYQWITQFWPDDVLDEVDPNADADIDAGQVRCDNDPGFFGSYAASNPEEDFAESFSAYVFDIETFSDEQRARLDWIGAQPGLAEYRDRAVAAGIESPPNNFDECGLG